MYDHEAQLFLMDLSGVAFAVEIMVRTYLHAVARDCMVALKITFTLTLNSHFFAISHKSVTTL